MVAGTKNIATPRPGRPGRPAKEKARQVIKVAIAKPPRGTKPRPSVASREPVASPSPPSPSDPLLIPSDHESEQFSTTSWNPAHLRSHSPPTTIGQRELMEKIDTRVRATMMGMFEQDVDKMGKVATAATVRVLGEEKLGEKDTSPLPFITPSPIATPAPPLNILSHWAWVETETVELIANGKFDINTLPKLHRKDELRNAYIRKVVKKIYQPFTDGPSEIMIGITKMQASFKDSTTFFSAWQVYISIRTSYQPKRGPGLADWTERLFYLISLDYPWPAILEYIIAYFQKYQDTLPDDWFNPDSNLISYHFALSPQRQVAVSVPATTPT